MTAANDINLKSVFNMIRASDEAVGLGVLSSAMDIAFNAGEFAATQRAAQKIDAIILGEGPTPEQEVKHLADQCETLLRENERLREACQLALDEATWSDEETPSKIAEVMERKP